MATPVFYTGDNWPPLQGTVKDANGAVVDISTAVSLRMVAKLTATIIAGTAVKRDASRGGDGVGTDGKWEYVWGTSDLDTAGVGWIPEIEVTWPSSKIETFRTDTETFTIKADND